MTLNFPFDNNPYAGYFNGTSSQYLSWKSNSNSNANAYPLSVSENFCIEFWIKWVTVPSSATSIINGGGAGTGSFSILNSTTLQLNNGGYNTWNTSAIYNIQAGTWYHIAWMGGNNVLSPGSYTNYISVNGLVYNYNDPLGTGYGSTGSIWNIGSSGTPAFWYNNCYVKDFRVTTGSMVYDPSNFVVPTARLGTSPSGVTRVLTLINNTLTGSTGTVANVGTFTFVSTDSPISTYTATTSSGNQIWRFDGTRWSAPEIKGPTGPIGTVGTGTSGYPKITSVTYTNASYVSTGATSVSTSGGYIKLTGTGFSSGCSVVINTTAATTTTYVNSTTVNVAVPALSAGTYFIYLTTTTGTVAVKPNGVVYA